MSLLPTAPFIPWPWQCVSLGPGLSPVLTLVFLLQFWALAMTVGLSQLVFRRFDVFPIAGCTHMLSAPALSSACSLGATSQLNVLLHRSRFGFLA